MEQCETEGCSGLVFKQHLCLVCANKLFDTATSSDAETIAKLRGDIQTMVEKAASKHRPAYDEQQATIATQKQEIAELKEIFGQAVEHIDNLQFCLEERGFFYCPNCGEGTTHTEDCYIGVFLAKHTKESGQ